MRSSSLLANPERQGETQPLKLAECRAISGLVIETLFSCGIFLMGEINNHRATLQIPAEGRNPCDPPRESTSSFHNRPK
jgi:hypothetical protein